MNRSISRLISIYDIILSPMLFVALIYTAVVLMLYQHQLYETEHGKTVELWTFILIGWWILLAMGLVASILQGYAGYKLLCATKKNIDAKDVIPSCRLWQGVAIFSIVVEIWATLSVLFEERLYMFSALTYIFIRILAVLLVEMHVKLLKKEMSDVTAIAEPKYKFNDGVMDSNFCNTEKV